MDMMEPVGRVEEIIERDHHHENANTETYREKGEPIDRGTDPHGDCSCAIRDGPGLGYSRGAHG